MDGARRVAVVGASNDRHKFGNKAVRAYLERGWTVFPVNPHETTIEGLDVHATVLDLPRPIQRVALYVPPEVGLTLLAELGQLAPDEIFLNPGTESPALLADVARRGLHVVQDCAIVAIGESPADYPG